LAYKIKTPGNCPQESIKIYLHNRTRFQNYAIASCDCVNK
jgi:hypothetical protein